MNINMSLYRWYRGISSHQFSSYERFCSRGMDPYFAAQPHVGFGRGFPFSLFHRFRRNHAQTISSRHWRQVIPSAYYLIQGGRWSEKDFNLLSCLNPLSLLRHESARSYPTCLSMIQWISWSLNAMIKLQVVINGPSWDRKTIRLRVDFGCVSEVSHRCRPFQRGQKKGFEYR